METKNKYWAARIAKAQDKITQKNRRQIERQIRKYYKTAAQQVITDFEDTYIKILNTMEKGQQPTPADLYKLDKYWHMQGQMRQQLQKLGEKQISKLTTIFELNFFEVYHSISLQGLNTYSTIDEAGIQQLLNQVWCADGKLWSQRVWENTKQLAATLNEELVNCIVSGKSPSYLKGLLQERFSVSFNNADMLVRTELAHIQTQAAQQRYKDYGIEQVEVLADKDERQCEVCGKLHGKRYPVNAQMPVPAHPRCRCTMIPVIDGY